MKKSILFMLAAFLVGASLSSCYKGGERKISTHNSSNSHNVGLDCISCHHKGGGGEGWFSAAGTVYDNTDTVAYPNTTVKLYDGINATGKLRYTIEVDNYGNFYTTRKIKFGAGLYPTVEGSNGSKSMSTAITTGQCASCHGVTTGLIWTE